MTHVSFPGFAALPPLEDITALHTHMFDAMPFGVSVFQIVNDTAFYLVFANHLAYAAIPGSTEANLGKQLSEMIGLEAAAHVERYYQQCITTRAAVVVEDAYELPIGTIWSLTQYIPLITTGDRVTHILVVWEDITVRKTHELETQRQLSELSTPVLAISDTTVVLPLIGTLDERRMLQIMQTLLTSVAASKATVVILDITGLPFVDTQVADALMRTSQAVGLLGARIILTGIRPEVAQTLVGLGVELNGIITRGTLRDGIAYALR